MIKKNHVRVDGTGGCPILCWAKSNGHAHMPRIDIPILAVRRMFVQ